LYLIINYHSIVVAEDSCIKPLPKPDKAERGPAVAASVAEQLQPSSSELIEAYQTKSLP
jgi:hypothetical protein